MPETFKRNFKGDKEQPIKEDYEEPVKDKGIFRNTPKPEGGPNSWEGIKARNLEKCEKLGPDSGKGGEKAEKRTEK